MVDYKNIILEKLCYTELVYKRINKKLGLKFSNREIEKMIFRVIQETDKSKFQKKGKNVYIINDKKNVILTINSYTNRIITADKLNKRSAG